MSTIARPIRSPLKTGQRKDLPTKFYRPAELAALWGLKDPDLIHVWIFRLKRAGRGPSGTEVVNIPYKNSRRMFICASFALTLERVFVTHTDPPAPPWSTLYPKRQC